MLHLVILFRMSVTWVSSLRRYPDPDLKHIGQCFVSMHSDCSCILLYRKSSLSLSSKKSAAPSLSWGWTCRLYFSVPLGILLPTGSTLKSCLSSQSLEEEYKQCAHVIQVLYLGWNLISSTVRGGVWLLEPLRRLIWPRFGTKVEMFSCCSFCFSTSSVNPCIVEMNKLFASLFSLDSCCFLFSPPCGPAASFSVCAHVRV